MTEGYLLTLSSDRLAKNVMIITEADGFFNDNYFDMLPGERKTVLFKTERILDNPKGAFKTKTLVDAWE